jgi:hypothetical protein
VILEVGGGSSTLILARYAQDEGLRGRAVKIVSLDHDRAFSELTRDMLVNDGTETYVEQQRGPLGRTLSDGGPWYVGVELPQGIDFVLIDGPPEGKGGRAAVLPTIWPHLGPNAVIWLDDANRAGERQALVGWLGSEPYSYSLSVTILPFGKNGAVELRRGGCTPMHVDASDVALTILTGRRPALLSDTIDSLRAYAPGLLESAQVIVLHNDGGSGADPLTRAQIELLRASVVETTSLYPIGRATSLLERAVRQSGAAYWLHLEDDWRLSSATPGWLDHAREILGTQKRPTDVAQVRLRHWSERVLPRHMVTRAPITWLHHRAPGRPPHATAQAHLTFNPFLARTDALTPAFPCTDEADFMDRGHSLGLRTVANLYPGVFTHLGEGSLSLRAQAKG